MELKCPKCGTENEIPKEDWPKDCSTSECHECWHCGEDFYFGVTAEIEIR